MARSGPPPLEGTSAPVEPPSPLGIDLRGRSLREHTARGVIINSAFQVAFAGLGVIRRLGAAAFLTATEFGVWGIVLVSLITLSWLKQVGISDKYIQQDDQDQQLAFQKAFTLELAISIGMFVLVVALLPVIGLIYGRSEIIGPGIVLALILPISALHTPLWITYRRMQFVRQRLLESIDPIVTSVVVVALAAYGAGVWALAIGPIVGATLTALAAVAVSPYRLAIRYDRGTIREYLSFSWPLALTSLCGLIATQGSILVATYTVGIAAVGAITLAGSFSVFSDRVEKLINRTMYPAVCSVKDRRDTLLEVFSTANRLGLMWGFPFGIGLALFAGDLVEFVFNDGYPSIAKLLTALGLIVAFNQIGVSWRLFFTARGNTRPLAISGALGLVVFALVTTPAMIILGLDGYILGLVASVLAQLGLRAFYLRQLFEGFRFSRHMARAIVPTVPAAAIVLGGRLLFNVDRSLLAALIELGVYVAITAIATLIAERTMLRELVGYLRGVRPEPMVGVEGESVLAG